MSGTDPMFMRNRLSSESLSILRHELVTPINLVVGYCELLLSEAADAGASTWTGPLHQIRTHAFSILNRIDRVLLADIPDRSIADLRQMAESLVGPVSSLIESAQAFDMTSNNVILDPGNASDLDKIRSASRRILTIVQELAAGRFPREVGPQVPSLDEHG